jgi:hypothetical protein
MFSALVSIDFDLKDGIFDSDCGACFTKKNLFVIGGKMNNPNSRTNKASTMSPFPKPPREIMQKDNPKIHRNTVKMVFLISCDFKYAIYISIMIQIN